MKYQLVVLCLCATVVGAHDGRSPDGVWKFVEDEKTGVVPGTLNSIGRTIPTDEHINWNRSEIYWGNPANIKTAETKAILNRTQDTLWVYDKDFVVIYAYPDTVRWIEYYINAGHDSVVAYNTEGYSIINSKLVVVPVKVWISDGDYQLGLRSDGVIVWRERKEK